MKYSELTEREKEIWDYAEERGAKEGYAEGYDDGEAAADRSNGIVGDFLTALPEAVDLIAQRQGRMAMHVLERVKDRHDLEKVETALRRHGLL